MTPEYLTANFVTFPKRDKTVVSCWSSVDRELRVDLETPVSRLSDPNTEDQGEQRTQNLSLVFDVLPGGVEELKRGDEHPRPFRRSAAPLDLLP